MRLQRRKKDTRSCGIHLGLLAAVWWGLAARTVAATPAPGVEPRPRLAYEVRLDRLADRRLQVRLQIRDWPGGRLRLRSVPTYVDNPTPRGRTEVVRQLVVRDSTGGRIAVQRGHGRHRERFYDLKLPPGGAIVTYDLAVDFVESAQTQRYSIEIPYMNAERAWLYGNCVFVVPEPAGAPSHAVRTPLDIQVRFLQPDDVPLVGPPETLRLTNLYALQSLQFGYGEFHVERSRATAMEFALVYRDTLEFRAAERARLRACTARIVDVVTRFFGGPAYPTVAFYYFRRGGIGGQEGSYALQTYAFPSLDVADTTDARVRAFLSVALHEFFHTWNPVALGAMDDPWVKEGLTSYYDEVLTARVGWSSRAERTRMLQGYKHQWASNPRFKEVPLTDPRIWQREYDGETWRTLTYDKGLVVSLLLDVWIRDRTANTRSLDDVMRALYQHALHAGVSHAALVDIVQRSTGVDATPFFSTYVEQPVAPSPSEVDAALARAESLEVFAPPTGR